MREIRAGQNPVCWHVLGQPLADELSAIVREQAETIKALRSSLKYVAALASETLNETATKPVVVSDNLLNDPALAREIGGAK